MFTAPGGRRGGLTLFALAASVAGIILIVVAVRAQVSEPTPQSAGRINPPTAAQSTSPSGGSSGSASPSADALTGGSGKAPLPASKPVRIQIPSIGVDSEVFPIGLAADGTLKVPHPGPRLNKTAWFKNSPTPGQPGPSIIEGHVDSVDGPSVFLKLGEVKPGAKIHVTRADGRVVTFAVNAVRDFAKAEFPTKLVYGGNNLGTPQLRLITCSDFDTALGTHIGNEVVFSHLVSVRRG